MLGGRVQTIRNYTVCYTLLFWVRESTTQLSRFPRNTSTWETWGKIQANVATEYVSEKNPNEWEFSRSRRKSSDVLAAVARLFPWFLPRLLTANLEVHWVGSCVPFR
jgi:hypothetical protein